MFDDLEERWEGASGVGGRVRRAAGDQRGTRNPQERPIYGGEGEVGKVNPSLDSNIPTDIFFLNFFLFRGLLEARWRQFESSAFQTNISANLSSKASRGATDHNKTVKFENFLVQHKYLDIAYKKLSKNI